MSLTYVSPKRPTRVYVRKFDHDEATRRYEEGETIVALAAEYGVHVRAVGRVVSPRQRASYGRYQESLKTADCCERCGQAKSRVSRYTHGSRLCLSCAADDQAVTVRRFALRCVTCREWKPDADFPLNRAQAGRRRGRHRQCRPCGTKARQAYRERQKVPCVGCGKLALPFSEKRTHGATFARCQSCQIRAMHRARRAAAVEPTAEEVGRRSRSTEASD